MKSHRTQFFVFAVLMGVSVFVLPQNSVSAALLPTATAPGYTQLENIPGSDGKNKTFPEYVTAIYNLGLWIIGMSAMFMLTVGGFMYLTSAGNTSAAGSAKGVIKDALIGLVLGLSAWLILNTINPDLTAMNWSGIKTGTSTPTPPDEGAPPQVPAEGQYTHEEAVAALSAADVSVHSTDHCSDQSKATCTSLQGIPKDTINKVIALKKSCGCEFNVTGGTEVGHASHGSGLPVVDVSQEQKLGDYLNSNKSSLASLGVSKICATSAWQKVSYSCPGYVEQKAHFHLVF